MTNILIEGGGSIASYELAVKGFCQFSKVMPICVRSKFTRFIKSSDISWCDILISVRANNPLSAWIVKEANRKGRKTILLLDDDLLNIVSNQHTYIDRIMKTSLVEVLKIVSHVITPSQYLGEKYRKNFNIEYVLSDTVLEKSEIRPVIPSNDKIKIIYAAAKGHIVFFNKLVSPIIDRLYDKYGESVSFTVIGPEIKCNNYKMDVEFVPLMPMDEYQAYMSCHHFDIGIAPLFATEVCYSKYYNKYLEYTKNNIFGIYSNQIPYNIVIENGMNGLLADGNPDSWFDCLCTAIDNASLRKEGVEAAQKQLLSDNNLVSIAERLKAAIPYFTSYKAPSMKCGERYCMFIKFIIYELVRRLLLLLKQI